MPILASDCVVVFFAYGGNDGGGTSKLVVDQEKIDYGDVKFGVNKTFTIKVTNTGDSVLRFKKKPYIQQRVYARMTKSAKRYW